MKSEVSSVIQFDQSDALIEKMIENVEKVIVGKRDSIVKAIIAFIAGGHILLEDVPGVGKTMLVRALARTIDCDYKRVQFTPDLMPSDITGVSIYNRKTMEFEFRPGPVFTNILLADEINRSSPKAQSAVLEAMEEKKVTIDGKAYELPLPFLLLATQNPLDHEGTYSLPEAQLDRFMVRIQLGYPLKED
ncbi:MAG TPA: AAA family ATPase, partial [Bacilli bacterium]